MYKLIGLIAVIAIGMWAMDGFGGLFGLTQPEIDAFRAMKTDAINRAAPVLSPLMTPQQILDTEQKVMASLPSASSVQATIELQVVPAITSAANQLGQAMASEVPPQQ